MDKKAGQNIFLNFRKKSGIWIMILGAFLGVLLLIYGGEEKSSDSTESRESELVEYTKNMEEKITELCSKVEGVKNVSVAVSLESGFEYVYASDGDKTLTVGSGASESPVRVTEKPPVIAGVGIVCCGGGSPAVQKKLIELISAAYGISSNKIYITESQK